MEILYGGGVVVGITILLEGLKQAIIPYKLRFLIPLMAVLLGIGCSFLSPSIQHTYPGEPVAYEIIIDGIIMGLAAVGVHQFGKKTVLRKTKNDQQQSSEKQ